MLFVVIKNKKGFTLVELLVVISIMGILTVVVSSSFRTIQMKSRDARRKSDLSSISKALNMYYNDVGIFPSSDDIDLNSGSEFKMNVGGSDVVYMVQTPNETTNGVKPYKYMVSGSGKSFKLLTNFENSEDISCLKNPDGSKITSLSSYSITSGCIYGVSSSNIGITIPIMP
ncbi:MAG: prepilin-type N-terminal cleavage/methylation domain-containing protein [Candidatus Shapirobacteria bacterium]|nr:prepilin-type N-terminal cleavage/methylation domain-containing protein [Candidatus Shapirobacteria bacterium]